MTNQTLRIDNDKNTTTNKTTLLALRPGWKPMFTAVAVGLMGWKAGIRERRKCFLLVRVVVG